MLRAIGVNLPNSAEDATYGCQRGNPETEPRLLQLRERFLTPFVNRQHNVIESGPGGGRWAQYPLEFEHVYAVDYDQPFLEALKVDVRASNVTFIKNQRVRFAWHRGQQC